MGTAGLGCSAGLAQLASGSGVSGWDVQECKMPHLSPPAVKQRQVWSKGQAGCTFWWWTWRVVLNQGSAVQRWASCYVWHAQQKR